MACRLRRLDFVRFFVFIEFIYLADCQYGSTCPYGWLLHGTSCYHLVTTKMTWKSARNFCTSLNSYLAEVTSDSEHQFLKTICEAGDSASYYIGGTDADAEGEWLWIGSGNTISYKIWGWDEPNGGDRQNCLKMFIVHKFAWDDERCDLFYPFFCEKEKIMSTITTEPLSVEENEMSMDFALEPKSGMTPSTSKHHTTTVQFFAKTSAQEHFLTTNLALETTAEITTTTESQRTTNIESETTAKMTKPVSTTTTESSPEQEPVLTTNVESETTAKMTKLVSTTTTLSSLEQEPLLTTNVESETTTEITTPVSTTTTKLSLEQEPVLITNVESDTTTEMTTLSLKAEISFSCAKLTCCPRNETREEIKQSIMIFRHLLAINKTSTSKFTRGFISAPDHRTSAVAIGYCGVVVLISFVLIIIAFDILKIIKYFGHCCRNKRIKQACDAF